MEGFKNNNDGLDFICEICGDREGGCQACGFGERQKRADKESDKSEKAGPEEIRQFFEDTRNMLDGM